MDLMVTPFLLILQMVCSVFLSTEVSDSNIKLPQNDLLAPPKSKIRSSLSKTVCERAFPPMVVKPKFDAMMRKVTTDVPLKGGPGPSHKLISQCFAQTYSFSRSNGE